jgi:hypothetical protein
VKSPSLPATPSTKCILWEIDLSKFHIIASKATFPQYDNDPDNFIYESHLFHKFFDGDGNRRPTHAHNITWEHSPNKLILQHDGTGSNHMFQPRCPVSYDIRVDNIRRGRGRLGETWRTVGEKVRLLSLMITWLTFRSFFHTTS